jgi:hypothetical protein
MAVDDEILPTRIELWPISVAVNSGWLLSGGEPWTSEALKRGETPIDTVSQMIGGAGLERFILFSHSTSWRMDESIILTYLSTFRSEAKGEFPKSRKIDEVFLDSRQGTTQGDVFRKRDVLKHGLRHLRFLTESDLEVSGSLTSDWVKFLKGFDPALAGEYGISISFRPLIP